MNMKEYSEIGFTHFSIRTVKTLFPGLMYVEHVPWGTMQARAKTLQEARVVLQEAQSIDRNYPPTEYGIYETELNAEGNPIVVRFVE